MRKLLLIISAVAALTACSTDAGKKDTKVDVTSVKPSNRIVGLWSLKAMDIQDSIGSWHVWNGGMQGYLLYDDNGHGALHLLTKDYEKFDLDFNNFDENAPIEALRHLNNSYNYMARYKILKDQGIVEHTRISHSNPGDWGKVVQRKYSFSGDTLILQPVEDENSALRLKWLKEK